MMSAGARCCEKGSAIPHPLSSTCMSKTLSHTRLHVPNSTRTTRAEGHGHGIGNLVDADLHLATGVIVEQDVLGLRAHDLGAWRRANQDALHYAI